MVHGLLKYNNIEYPIMLRGLDEVHSAPPAEDQNMKEWNPLLVAIANKKLEVVRYLLNDSNVSLKMAGCRPDLEDGADIVEGE